MDTKADPKPARTCPPDGHPVTRLLEIVSGKWSLPVLYHLRIAGAPVRFGALRKAIGRVTQKELTRTLREFEDLGLVTRTVYPEVPPRVEYALTDLGGAFCEPVLALADWAISHEAELVLAYAARSARRSEPDGAPDLVIRGRR